MDNTLKGFAESLRGLTMPELRKDPIVGRWVIIATDRAKRPVAAPQRAVLADGDLCPFCEGNESHTPHEILAYRSPGDSAPTNAAGASASCRTSSPRCRSKAT